MSDYAANLEDGLPAEYYTGLEKHLEGRHLPLDLDEFLELEFRYFLEWSHSQISMETQRAG
ncbi:MAG: hypothetical protein JXA62_07585 [Candidatus Aminicenantes bacterium]|nr:hypothetical protein [Candidatus Aminicenantes bacterium]